LPVEPGRGGFLAKNGAKGCLFFTGSLYIEIVKAQAILEENKINTDIYNLRFIKPVDEDFFTGIINEYKLAVFIEEGIRQGGFGEYASELVQRKGCKTATLVLAVENNSFENDLLLGTREELLFENELDGNGIAKSVISKLKL
jgi:1-deoxy-D-xylulose-5-phosphate synthase